MIAAKDTSVIHRPRCRLHAFCTLLVGLLVTATTASCSLAHKDSVNTPLVSTFDGDYNSFSTRLLRHRAITLTEGNGIHGSNAIQVVYKGSPQGSERVVVNHSLIEGSLDATLTYDVRFCDDFQFVKSGKLHGLGPQDHATGGLPFGPAQWSARVAFLSNGRIGTYLYHQDLPGRYGEITSATDFMFEPNRYYSVALYVRINDPPEADNGRAELFVDGVKVVDKNNVRFRGADGKSTLVQKLLFQTFHGGHTPNYAPRNDDGSFSRECAYFDNIAVYPGFSVKETPGS